MTKTFQEALTSPGNKIPPGACGINPAAPANPALAPLNRPAGACQYRDIRLDNPGLDKRNQQAKGTQQRPMVGIRGPGVIQGHGKEVKGNFGFKGDGKGKGKGNRLRTNPHLPIGAIGAGNDRWLNTNPVRMTESDHLGDDQTIEAIRAVAMYIASLIPEGPITNRAMADSQVNDIRWHSLGRTLRRALLPAQ